MKTNALLLHDGVRALGITNPVAYLISSVSVLPSGEALSDDQSSLLRTLQECPESILNRREVRGFEDLSARLGYPSRTPAGRYRIELVQRHGFHARNNLVDAYNLASLEFCSSVGLHDVSGRQSLEIHVYRAAGSETIKPLGKAAPQQIPRGDLVYGFRTPEPALLAALGKGVGEEADFDSDDSKVTDRTTSALLVALGNAETRADYNRELCERVLYLIRLTCPAATGTLLPVRDVAPVVELSRQLVGAGQH
jgi:DNA/RNA-binding domain of Phe-tRNA-synthetase-like protein